MVRGELGEFVVVEIYLGWVLLGFLKGVCDDL